MGTGHRTDPGLFPQALGHPRWHRVGQSFQLVAHTGQEGVAVEGGVEGDPVRRQGTVELHHVRIHGTMLRLGAGIGELISWK